MGPWPLPLKLNHSYSACATGNAWKPRARGKHHKAAPPVFNHKTRAKGLGHREPEEGVGIGTANEALLEETESQRNPRHSCKTTVIAIGDSSQMPRNNNNRSKLQLKTPQHWSSRQQPQLALQTHLSTPTKWSNCSRVVRRRCEAYPRNRRRTMQLVNLRHWSSRQPPHLAKQLLHNDDRGSH